MIFIFVLHESTFIVLCALRYLKNNVFKKVISYNTETLQLSSVFNAMYNISTLINEDCTPS